MESLENTNYSNEGVVLVKSLLSPVEVVTVEDYGNLDGQWFINEYLNSLRNENTREAFKKSINDWFTFCYGNKLLTLKDMIINDFKAIRYTNYWQSKIRKDPNKKVKGEISISTYNQKIKGVRLFYEWLKLTTRIIERDYQYIKYNPFDSVHMIDETDSVGSMALTPEEVLMMIDNPYGKTQEQRERNLLIFELALVTGLRRSTLLDLKPSDIQHIDEDILMQKYTKRNKITSKPITSYYDRIIKWYNYDVVNRAVDNGTIFNLSPVTANEMIKRWVKSCKINKKVTFHGLRATCAILIFHDTNENTNKVQSFLDHDEEKITKRYLKKEKYVDYSGINALENLKKSKVVEEPKQSTSDELLNLISTLDEESKLNILKMLKGA
jgi:integrase